MILSLNYQAQLFLTTVAIGAVLGFFYDIIRILRLMVPHKNFVLQIEDAFYWITVVMVMFLFMLHRNYGEIRFFSICGAFLGMLFYFLSLSKLIMKISSTIIHIIKKILSVLMEIILTPFRLLWLLFRKPVRKTQNFVQKKGKNLLHFMKVYAKIKLKGARRTAHIIRRKK